MNISVLAIIVTTTLSMVCRCNHEITMALKYLKYSKRFLCEIIIEERFCEVSDYTVNETHC